MITKDEQEKLKAKIQRKNYYQGHKEKENKQSKAWNRNNVKRKRATNAARYEKHRVPTLEKPRKVIEHGVIKEKRLEKRWDEGTRQFAIWDLSTNVRVYEDDPRFKELLLEIKPQGV